MENDYDIAVQLDGDGQHDPSYLGELVRPIESGEANICIGSRFVLKTGFQSSGLRKAGIFFLSFVINLCIEEKIKDVTSGFRAVDRRYIEFFANDYPQDYPEPEAIVMAYRNGAILKEIPVVMREREKGTSSIDLINFKICTHMVADRGDVDSYGDISQHYSMGSSSFRNLFRS